MITKEEDNFLRTVYLHYRVGTRALRRYFDSKHPNLTSDLSLNYNKLHNLYKRRTLYQAQWDILYPPAEFTDIWHTEDLPCTRKNRRVVFPLCVVCKIRKQFPAEQYTCFKWPK